MDLTVRSLASACARNALRVVICVCELGAFASVRQDKLTDELEFARSEVLRLEQLTAGIAQAAAENDVETIQVHICCPVVVVAHAK